MIVVRRRALTWALALPLVGVSVLVGHTVAYALAGRDPGAAHAYLAHAPQLLALLALVGLLGLAVDQRAERLRAWPFAGLGVLVFGVQEHLEGYAHAGEVPFLLTERAFVLGVLLQVPVGLLVVALACRLASSLRLTGAGPSRPRLHGLTRTVRWSVVPHPVASDPGRALSGRGPPPIGR
ncbi:MAG: hypothetical protein ACRC50_03545 [Gaiella sp.]